MGNNGPIRLGVIAAAGKATRMWPVSKVVPKELFPLGRLPVISHVISELFDAKIDHIMIVVRKETIGAIRSLLDPDLRAPAGLPRDGRVSRFQRAIREVKFSLVEQGGTYGNGSPLVNASIPSNQAFVYAFADDLVFGENASSALMSTFYRTGHPVLAAQTVRRADVREFGIMECRRSGTTTYLRRYFEKPKPNRTRSRLASLGRFIITPEVNDFVRQTPVGHNGELWLSDAFKAMLRQDIPIAVHELKEGMWHTVGTPHGFARTVSAVARFEARQIR